MRRTTHEIMAPNTGTPSACAQEAHAGKSLIDKDAFCKFNYHFSGALNCGTNTALSGRHASLGWRGLEGVMGIIRKLWCGQYSLGVAFWGFYLVGFVVVLLLIGITFHVANQYRLGAMALAVGLILSWAYSIIATV